MYVRTMAEGRKLGDFSHESMRWCNLYVTEMVHDLYIQAYRSDETCTDDRCCWLTQILEVL